MLKAKFALPTKTILFLIEEHNKHGETPDAFIVEPVKYNDEQCIVVAKAQPIMYLIGAAAAAGFDSLLDVTSL